MSDDIDNLNDRIRALEERVDRLDPACRDMEIMKLEAQVKNSESLIERYQKSGIETNHLLIALAKILRLRGPVTSEKLLEAARGAMGIGLTRKK